MLRNGFVSNSSSTSFIVILNEPIPATLAEFRHFVLLNDERLDLPDEDYEQFPRRMLFERLIADAQTLQENDFMEVRRLLQQGMDDLPSVVAEGELASYISDEHKEAFQKELKKLDRKYLDIAVQEIRNIMHHESSHTYVFNYSDNTEPFDFNAAMEHGDYWDYLAGTVIPLSHH
jgi:hypothetical protein